MVDKKIVIPRGEISRRVGELAKAITKDYAYGELVIVGILNGAFIFTADLVRGIELPLEVDFVKIASYGSNTYSSGEIRFAKDIELDIGGKDVLLVEDIVDTGRTIACLKDMFGERRANSIKVCTLIDKKERREVEMILDYVGFEIQEGFLVGYGLDYAEQYRNYPDVYHLLNDTSGKNE